MHKTLSENKYKDISESECNIFHETLSQNNFADIPDNDITELKDDEHKETSVTEKVTIIFSIFECGRNILDQLDVTYQRAFMATSAQDEYYKEMTKSLIKANNHKGEPFSNERLRQAVIDLRAETDAKHERNINNIT